MAEPLGVLGLLLLVVGLANAVAPQRIWPIRRLPTHRTRARLADATGQLTGMAQRLNRFCGVVAAVVGATVVIVALAIA